MRGKNALFSAAVILLILGSPVFAYRQLIDLGTLGGQQSCAYSINDKDQIVGWAGQNPNSSGDLKACLFDASGGGANKSLGARFGQQESHAYSINDSGQIVGQIYVKNVYYHACVFDSMGNGANKDLGSGCAYSNNESEIVGFRTKACIFDSTGNGNNIDLGAIGVGRYSTAYSINDSGLIVGSTYINNNIFSNITHACIFDSTGNGFNIDLGTLGGSSSEALSINNSGQIVGWALPSLENQNPFEPLHACLFDSTGHGNNIDLNTLIDPSSGWTLNYAYCINNSGWIVGQGTYHGDGRAFLLTPEPATLLLFGLGGVILRKLKSY